MKDVPFVMRLLGRYMGKVLAGLRTDESGQDIIEYALIAAFIGLGAVASMSNLTNHIIGVFTSVGTTFSSAS